ncbi:transglycosylase domain-containing protein [Amnibacterium setariae]|uniref:PASTA domain-containing protein n=1 Tax=Amnibacterium setariae TaxID=2306585 RepID=A0A3A1TS45_9MICO|nr:transglycosylase domain-containing protein [Amnibacterium setariae]RIX26516.1 PASTA domain-containing protein [Amnibacterium setariae]
MSARPRRTGSAFAGILGILVVAGVMLTAGVAPAMALTAKDATGGSGWFAPIPDDLKLTNYQQKTQIYAKSGGKDKLLASFYNQNREVIRWDDVPATVKNATLAAEDTRFYDHGGVDPTGILRAFVSNLTHGGGQGASTITQQYVKNVCIQEAELLPTEAQVTAAYQECTGGIQRKLREARNAIGLEKVYDKDQILLGYLNIAGFGGRIYGIQAAAKYYFDVDAKDLSVAQAASLMAIVNNPAFLRIDEKANLPANKVRRDYILGVEKKEGWITAAQYQEAVQTPVKPKITPTTAGCAGAGSAAYFCDYVSKIIQKNKTFGETDRERYNKLQSSGWKIYTTLDLGLQKKASEAMKTYVPSASPVGTDMGGAAVSVQPGTGRVLSMVQSKRYDDTGGKGTGGKQYTATAVNWNTDRDYGGSGGFQPGSTYKTFSLVDWLEHGHGLNEVVDGSGRTVPAGNITACKQPAAPYPVKNDEPGEGGYQTVLFATQKSVNGAYASMAEKLDLCDIRDRAEDLLVHRADGDPLQYKNPSSILGTNEVAPLTMATAYAGIANKGVVCAPIAIDKIVASNGDEVPVPKADCHRAIPAAVAVAAGYALNKVITGGTAAADRYAAGSAWSFAKTGTTNDAIDTWVVGGTTKAVSAVWVGNVGRTAPKQSLRLTRGFPYCQNSTVAANTRHCLWSAVMAANQAKYPGDTSWPTPESQYLYGQKISVPDVTGKAPAEARKILETAGFQVKRGGTASSDVPKGQVAGTDPAAGGSVPGGTVVTLAISAGPAPQAPPAPQPGTTAVVPNVMGSPISNALATLAQAGFTKVDVQWFPQGGNLCLVAQQTPNNTPADPAGTTVQLSVAGDQNACQQQPPAQ